MHVRESKQKGPSAPRRWKGGWASKSLTCLRAKVPTLNVYHGSAGSQGAEGKNNFQNAARRATTTTTFLPPNYSQQILSSLMSPKDIINILNLRKDSIKTFEAPLCPGLGTMGGCEGSKNRSYLQRAII